MSGRKYNDLNQVNGFYFEVYYKNDIIIKIEKKYK
jgi:hypothetical protein